MNFTPLRDNVIVKLPEETTQTQSGLFIAKAVETHQEAEVLAVGDGEVDAKTGELVPMSVSVGDKVIITRGTGLVLDKEERILYINEKDIFGKVS